MGRTIIKRIENPAARQVTLAKRRRGLLKKAHDLSVLCDAELAVIIFSSKEKVFQFASPSMGTVLDRYEKTCEDLKASNCNNSSDNVGYGSLTQSSQKLSPLHSNLNQDDLKRPSLRDLTHLEQQMHDRFNCLHTKKEELLLEQLENVRQQEEILLKQLENVGEMATEAERASCANSNILKKLLDLATFEITGFQNPGDQGGAEHHCLHEEIPQTGSSFLGWRQGS